MKTMDLIGKFNIGLTLETSPDEFRRFLDRYHPFLHSVYFSLPLGRRFQTRKKIALQSYDPRKKRLFWQLLALVREYGIGLELLLNSVTLDDRLIEKAAKTMERHGFVPDSVCFLSQYYPAVERFFPTQKYILSYNNFYRSKAALDEVLDAHRADAVVLGAGFLRNSALFSHLAARGTQVYLLLNNGCSFNCATCAGSADRCADTFRQNLQQHSAAYLYALQSVFPCELTDGIIDCTDVTCFKLSNRSSDLSYLQTALDSYLHNEVRRYVEADPNSYALWGRVGYFREYFPTLRLEDVIAEKQKILRCELDVK